MKRDSIISYNDKIDLKNKLNLHEFRRESK
jgi:hypothetical protein